MRPAQELLPSRPVTRFCQTGFWAVTVEALDALSILPSCVTTHFLHHPACNRGQLIQGSRWSDTYGPRRLPMVKRGSIIHVVISMTAYRSGGMAHVTLIANRQGASGYCGNTSTESFDVPYLRAINPVCDPVGFPARGTVNLRRKMLQIHHQKGQRPVPSSIIRTSSGWKCSSI